MIQVFLNDLIGKPFENGGRGPETFDCYGLAMTVFKRFGIIIEDQDANALDCAETENVVINATKTGKWEKIKGPITPCMVAIRNHPRFVSHVGTYIGEGKFIHTRASGMDSNSGFVCVERINDSVWKNRIEGFYRYVC